MIYGKPINEITWENIVEFCEQQIPEGAHLDYKQDFPKNLEKTISALANTLGGMILIGVAEDDENKPVLPLNGIQFRRGLSEQVINIILSNISPPVFPEVQVCSNADKTYAIVVIRVPQSHESPHAIAENTQVYLRTGNRNNPESLAKVGEIQWLVNQRMKSLDLREQLWKDADIRFKNLYAKNQTQLKKENSEPNSNKQGWFTLSLCPNYPKDAYCSPPQLNRVLRNIMVPDYFRTSNEFPITGHPSGTIFQNGIVLGFFDNERVFHSELNIFGLYFFRQILQWKFAPPGQVATRIMRVSEILARLDEFVDSGVQFYRELSYSGPLLFSMSLQDILDCALKVLPQEELLYSVDNEVHYAKTMLAAELEHGSFDLVNSAFQQVAWAYNWNPSPEFLKGYFAKNKR